MNTMKLKNLFKTKPKCVTAQYKQYVILRTDIPRVQQTIQIAHAAILAESEYGSTVFSSPRNRPLIILKVSNKFKLRLLSWYLKLRNFNVSLFYEPDNNLGLTALSFICLIETHLGDLTWKEFFKDKSRAKEYGNPVRFLKKWI